MWQLLMNQQLAAAKEQQQPPQPPPSASHSWCHGEGSIRRVNTKVSNLEQHHSIVQQLVLEAPAGSEVIIISKTK